MDRNAKFAVYVVYDSFNYNTAYSSSSFRFYFIFKWLQTVYLTNFCQPPLFRRDVKQTTFVFSGTWDCCIFLKQGKTIASLCTLRDCSAARFLVVLLASVPGGSSLIQKVILPNNAGVRGLCKREAWQNPEWKFTQHLPIQWLDSAVLPSVVRCIGMCIEEKPKKKVDPRF